MACFRQAVIDGQPLLLHGPIWQSPVGKPGTEPDPAQHGKWPLFRALPLSHFEVNSILFRLNGLLSSTVAAYGSDGLVCKKSNSDVQARRRKSGEKGEGEEGDEEEEEGRDPATTLQAMAGPALPQDLHHLWACCLIIEDMHLTLFISTDWNVIDENQP